MKTYALDDDTILVEGWLREDRFCKIYDLTGEAVDKGPVHHIAIRLKLGGTPLTILDAEAEMEHVPLEYCRTTLDRIKKTIGLQISPGFAKKVRNRIGGEQGCVHLTHLLTVLSQAAFQGFAALKRKHRHPLPESIDAVDGIDSFLGSCRSWKKDGPKVKKLNAAITSGRHNLKG